MTNYSEQRWAASRASCRFYSLEGKPKGVKYYNFRGCSTLTPPPKILRLLPLKYYDFSLKCYEPDRFLRLVRDIEIRKVGTARFKETGKNLSTHQSLV